MPRPHSFGTAVAGASDGVGSVFLDTSGIGPLKRVVVASAITGKCYGQGTHGAAWRNKARATAAASRAPDATGLCCNNRHPSAATRPAASSHQASGLRPAACGARQESIPR